MTVVIDTSALMAFIKHEPGGDGVAAQLGDGIVSPVIFAETLGKLAAQGFDAEAVRRDLLAAGLRVETFGLDEVPSVVALQWLANGRISLADRICLALAIDRSLPVLTGDREWSSLGLPLDVRLIR